MYKEQMFTLSDYYTIALSCDSYRQALEVARIVNAEFALCVALKLTYDVTVQAFGSNCILAERLERSLGKLNAKVTSANGKCCDMPFKYPYGLVLTGLSRKIMNDSAARNSLSTALKSNINKKFIARVLDHIVREGY